MKYKRVQQESLQVGDILHLRWCGDKHILRFEEYKGVFDFVDNSGFKFVGLIAR